MNNQDKSESARSEAPKESPPGTERQRISRLENLHRQMKNPQSPRLRALVRALEERKASGKPTP